MASKRQLKKEIILEVTQLFDEAIILRSLATGQSMELELEELMDDIMVLTDDSLRRVAHPDGKDNPRLIRAYYRGLRQHIAQHVADFSDRLDLFVEGIYGIKG
ncbi:hypothetical protein [Porphyromonas sp. oral taxon 275]|jgi:hypothetical protein|uniref:hypothetical protein n=1 Tax=Porphyromonas sp. oral taxon 275 TaxID=712435 RepID=UPI001BA70627|nr:hypothetical protein [Porphyromonas sp. oral taxon 275]MBF1046905.1 hypothetical protein [Porphyromonadaceae bacterium]QUB43697.1 hypothetical protein J4862_03520 [Porphyromonas sp. oral taxon 275]